MSFFQAFLLGFVQGLTEFLPVSSSAHLIFFQHLLGFKESLLAFDIVLHLGTLTAVLIYFAKDLVPMVRDSSYGIFCLLRRRSWTETFEAAPYFRWFLGILTASLPTGLMGILFGDWFEVLFGSLELTGVMLLLNSILLRLTLYFQKGRKGIEEMRVTDFVIIGVFQGIAIIPGISRSGATIASGLFLGMERETAFRFSFLIAIPAILGAGIFELRHWEAFGTLSPLDFGIGFLVSAVAGFLALFILRRMIKRGKLQIFSLYTFLLGVLILLLSPWLE